MKLGYITACLPQLQLEDLVKWSAGAGFQFLELAAWPYESDRDYQARQIDAANFSNEKAEMVKEIFDKYGMAISALAYYDNNLHPDLKKENFISITLKKSLILLKCLKLNWSVPLSVAILRNLRQIISRRLEMYFVIS